MNYQPLEDRILVRPTKSGEDEKTGGGLYVPVTVKKDVLKGEVYAAGLGVYARDTGAYIQTVLSKGDIILFGAAAGMDISVDTENGKEEMRIMREGDVLMLISRASENS